MMRKILVLVGTRKGLFVLESDEARQAWTLEGPFLKGWQIFGVTADFRQGPVLLAGVSSYVYGPHVQISRDLGRTWEPVEASPKLPGKPQIPPHPDPKAEAQEEAVSPKLKEIWLIQPGREEGVLWAGVADAALFRSGDGGMSWELVESLYNHPTRAEWTPGNGGLCLHSVVEDPFDRQRMYVGISSVGTLRSDDAGQTWAVKNEGIDAWWPGWGRCVHRLVANRESPGVLYQQNHTGVFRSRNAGDSWERIEDGLPSFFGFPMVSHPRDSQVIYVVPEESDEYRMPVGGQLAVYRSTDGGDSWHELRDGLPGNIYQGVLRDGMHTDSLDPAGIYFGTTGGQIYHSRDEGQRWAQLPGAFPRILSVRAEVWEG